MQDIDRPDQNKPPKMKEICEFFERELKDIAPVLNVTTDDNLLSSIAIKGSFDPKDKWPNNILQNSRWFLFCIHAHKGKRYYEKGDKLTVTLGTKHYNLPNFRKYTGTPEKVLAKIKYWCNEITR